MCKAIYLFLKNWWEAKTVVAPAYADTCRYNQVTRWIKITDVQVIDITKVWNWMFNFIDFMIVHDDGIKDVSKYSVCIRIASVDTNTAVRVFAT